MRVQRHCSALTHTHTPSTVSAASLRPLAASAPRSDGPWWGRRCSSTRRPGSRRGAVGMGGGGQGSRDARRAVRTHGRGPEGVPRPRRERRRTRRWPRALRRRAGAAAGADPVARGGEVRCAFILHALAPHAPRRLNHRRRAPTAPLEPRRARASSRRVFVRCRAVHGLVLWRGAG